MALRYKCEDGKLHLDTDALELTAENLKAATDLKNFLTLRCDLFLESHPEYLSKMGDYVVRIIVTTKV